MAVRAAVGPAELVTLSEPLAHGPIVVTLPLRSVTEVGLPEASKAMACEDCRDMSVYVVPLLTSIAFNPAGEV